MLTTEMPDLVLRTLTQSQALELHNLLQQNRDHLTAHGDYTDQVAMSYAEIEAELAVCDHSSLRFGLLLRGALIGRIDLVAVDPPKYGLGYWLAEKATGKGYATAALQALTDFARSNLRATDIYAGVSRGNLRSEALLGRAGFLPVADFDSYRRFHLSLA
ncbi:putative ribosomal N-acetyltransferase YdaF [Devosia sp. LC5]|uniref:GNAT family N-acetyltransferase n=1 Tax=Devosia sp. LC5 TaxID=1502724 RepID=UPI0004E44CCA|nr:GNAT family protein [Devosia sp. LC5]KFC61994.1 putative ribosomal N-acetyltransferase YdaF [Devosia sp. LC5]